MNTVPNTLTSGTDRQLETAVLIFLKRYLTLNEGWNYTPGHIFSLLADDPQLEELSPELTAHLKVSLAAEDKEVLAAFIEWEKLSYITSTVLRKDHHNGFRALLALQAFEQKVYNQDV